MTDKNYVSPHFALYLAKDGRISPAMGIPYPARTAGSQFERPRRGELEKPEQLAGMGSSPYRFHFGPVNELGLKARRPESRSLPCQFV